MSHPDALSYSLAEAAEITGVSTDTLRAAINATEPPYLRAKKLGTKRSSRIVIRRDALDAWLESLPDA